MRADDERRLAAARLLAAERQPFLAVALYALTAIPSPGLGTFGVDERWRLYIDPETLQGWSVEEVAGVLLHEVGHLVRDHAGRARRLFVDHTTQRIWNIAGDAEMNDDLRRDGVTLPKDGVLPSKLGLRAGRAAEYYYRELLHRTRSDLPEADCGEGAHGVSDEFGHRGTGGAGVHSALPPGVEPVEADLIRRQVAVAIGRQAGTVPGGWSRWASGFLAPQVDWRRQLRTLVGASLTRTVPGRTDFTYSRPSRRRIPNVVLPALVTGVPTVAVVIDTSASVEDQLLERAWSETVSIIRSYGVRREQVAVWAADTVARRVDLRRTGKVELVGGGGTDMAAAIERAGSVRNRPDLIVVLTDGETPWPLKAPAVEVVVGLLAPEAHVFSAVPSWATAVTIER
ncbi:MAG: VWA-like domain-containing protein [Acidimicrobiales bacterium]